MPTNALAPGFNKHHAWAIVIKSPQGFKLSPYLPRPLCSNEENVTMASNWGTFPSRTNFLSDSGVTRFIWGCSFFWSAYSKVVIFLAPRYIRIASTQGEVLPMTSTCLPSI